MDRTRNTARDISTNKSYVVRKGSLNTDKENVPQTSTRGIGVSEISSTPKARIRVYNRGMLMCQSLRAKTLQASRLPPAIFQPPPALASH